MSDEHPPLVAVKTYTVTVTIVTTLRRAHGSETDRAIRTRHKVVSGLTNEWATARQIADDTAQALAAVYCGKATITAGPVEFGPVAMGIMPERGFYVEGRLVR